MVASAVVLGRFASGQTRRVRATALSTIHSLLGTWSAPAVCDIGRAERRVGVGEEWADADHVEVERFEELNVAGEHLVGLAGDADHDAAADLVAHFAQFDAAARCGR